MHSFERLLLEKGYQPHGWRKGSWVPIDNWYYSSMGDVQVRFIKGDTIIQFGLNEMHHAPTLTSPQWVVQPYKFENGLHCTRTVRDYDMDRLFMEKTPEEVLELIETKQQYKIPY